MKSKLIDVNIKSLFHKLEETGILLVEERLTSLIRESQKRLAEQKQAINRETGFMVNLYSEDHRNRALDKVRSEDSFLPEQLIGARRLSFLIRRFLQVRDLANGNHRIRGRQFGLYPKYGLDFDGKIITTSELSINDLPEEVMGVIGCKDMVVIKATYHNIILSNIRKSSGDPWVVEATAMDLMKVGFVNLLEDYKIGKLDCRIFAISDCSAYLFAPGIHIDLISAVVRECLGIVHSDFALPVDVTVGVSLDKLV